MKVAYYKGCLASLSAKELDISTQALAPMLDLELEELESVTCCGAGDIHEAEPDYYLHLNARILAYAEATGADTLMTICNVCTLNLRQANWQLKGDEALRERVNATSRRSACRAYSGNVDVKHFLWLIAEGEGYELLKQVAHKGLKGLKVAPFYGCQILRPSKIMGFEDPDRPWSLEAIIEACGGEAIDYPAKIKCCGFPIIQAREETALGELIQPIEQAMERGRRRDGDAVPALPPVARRVAVEAARVDGPGLPDADPAPLAADRRRRRLRGVGAALQAARRLGRARPREAPGLKALAGSRRGRARLGVVRGGMGAARHRDVAFPGCRPSSTACGSRTSRTSTSACPDGRRARSRRAVEWVEERQPDLTLRQRRPAHARLRRGDAASRSLPRLPRCYAILGNHDLAISRDPFSSGRS